MVKKTGCLYFENMTGDLWNSHTYRYFLCPYLEVESWPSLLIAYDLDVLRALSPFPILIVIPLHFTFHISNHKFSSFGMKYGHVVYPLQETMSL